MFARDPLQLLASLSPTAIVVLVILLAVSICSWGVILSKWRLLRLSKQEDQQFLDTYRKTAPSGGNGLKDLQRLAATLPHSPSGVVFLGIMGRVNLPDDDDDNATGTRSRRSPGPDRDYLENVLHCLVQNQTIRQEAYLPFLATTGNLAPFIGLMGTVVGVINAFQQIGMQGTASVAAVAPGVAEALIATAAGLFVAIPAVIGYNYFLAAIRKIVFGLESFGVELLNALEGMVAINRTSKRTR